MSYLWPLAVLFLAANQASAPRNACTPSKIKHFRGGLNVHFRANFGIDRRCVNCVAFECLYFVMQFVVYEATTTQKNLEMSGNLTAVGEMLRNWPKVIEVKTSCKWKLFIADFTFGAIPVFNSIMHYACLLTTREHHSVQFWSCLYVCQTIIFESLDVGSTYLHMRHISPAYRSSSCMKVIGSRSQVPKRLKIPNRPEVNTRN